MLLSLLMGISLISGTSLLGMEFALHAITAAQQQEKDFIQATHERLAQIPARPLNEKMQREKPAEKMNSNSEKVYGLFIP